MHAETVGRYKLGLLLSATGLACLPHSQHLPALIFGFFTVAWVWRVVAVRYAWMLPNRWLLLMLVILSIALLISQRSGLFGRDAGTAIFVVALGLKLLEIHGRRDIYLVVYLTCIAAASQFLYQQTIWMALYIMLVCMMLLAVLVQQNSNQHRVIGLFRIALTITGQALPMAIALFMLFPRLEAPRWMWLKDDNKALSGLGDTLEPGSISELSLSDELVFRVRFQGDIPPPQLRYWRGPVYSATDGVRWTMTDKRKPLTAEPEFSGERFQYTLLLEPQKENWVFALDLPETFDGGLHRNAYYQLLADNKKQERAEYRIVSRPVYNTGEISEKERQNNLQLPTAPSEQQLALIRSLGGALDPSQFIRNLLNHFHQADFYYTLTPPLMPDAPVDTFLFKTRRGFCSHYATAFVYLLRAADIPARVVGGYQGGEVNLVGGFLEVRQANAHAWAEAWLAGRGWVRFDPTAAVAPQRIERGIDVEMQIARGAVSFDMPVSESMVVEWLKHSRQLWRSIDYNWQRWVVHYDTANQMLLLQALGIEGLASLAKWLAMSIAILVLPLAWCLLRRNAKKADKALQIYRKFCGKLAATGLQRQMGEGALDFAGRVTKQCPGLAEQVEQITTLFIRLRYQANPKSDDLRAFQALVRSFRILAC